jgi:DNA modification methylase
MNETTKPPALSLPTDESKIGSGQISHLAIGDLTPDPLNPRKHSRAQVRAIAKSIKAFGFTAPILTDKFRKIVAGHGRFEGAQLAGLTHVPVIILDHLTDTQAKALMLADNALHDRSKWDDPKLAVQLKELSDLDLGFDIEAIGFELPEIDVRIQSIGVSDAADRADEFEAVTGAAVSIAGDLWLLGSHRLFCGNALEPSSYATLMEHQKAAAVVSDSPYNVKISGHVSGNGKITHREFAMGVGELSPEEFTSFLATSLKLMCDHAAAGAVIYCFIDWRHLGEMVVAGHAADCDLLNVIAWVKNNSGMGSFYRSRHELIFVFRNGSKSHLNNIELGRFGRNRSNVWFYPGVSNFRSKDAEDVLALHPTPKPIAMIADAIMDCTNRGDVVLDPFAGSGTTILAAERTGRRCFAIEIDGQYCDTIIARWEKMTGQQAVNVDGRTFTQVKLDRASAR